MSSPEPKRIRVGVVGANPTRSWASMSHMPALAALPEFELVAVATTKPESAKQAAEAFGARLAFTSAEELAAHDEVDLVVAAVKAPAHAAVIRAALAAGKHVLSEWPLGVDLAEAIALADEAAAAGVVNAVALQGVYAPGARYVHDLIASGDIGRVEALSLVTSSGFGGTRIAQNRVWTADPKAGVSLLSILGGHVFATLDTMVGPLRDLYGITARLTEQSTVNETGERVSIGTPDQILIAGTLSDGGISSVILHGNTPPAAGGFMLRIVGRDATLLITPAEPSGALNHSEWNITAIRTADNSIEQLAVPASYRIVPPEVPLGLPANIAAIYREIGLAINESRDAYPSFATAVKYHQLLETATKSYETGQRQAVS